MRSKALRVAALAFNVVQTEMLFRVPWYMSHSPIAAGVVFVLVTLATLWLMSVSVGFAIRGARNAEALEEWGDDVVTRLQHDRTAPFPAERIESAVLRQDARDRVADVLDTLPSDMPRLDPVFYSDASVEHRTGGAAYLTDKGDAILMISQDLALSTTEDELRAVMAHEMAHQRHGDTHNPIMVTAWSMIGVACWAVVLSVAPWLWAVPITAVVTASYIVALLVVVIPAEVRADATAVETTGDPFSLADYIDKQTTKAGTLTHLLHGRRIEKLRAMTAAVDLADPVGPTA